MSNAFDVPLQALPPSPLVPMPAQWNPLAPPVPQPSPIPMPGATVPPAVAARQRHDTKKDVATKVGRQVLKSAAPPANATPPLPPNPMAQNAPAEPVQKAAVQGPPVDPTTGKPMTAPQQQNTPFTPATYQTPKKGLEYLALGLGVLFPGSQISKLATGFAGGLNTGAKDKYKRDEAQAEQTYKVNQANSQNEYQNAVARYGQASDEAKRAFVNQQAQNGVDQATAEAQWKVKVADLTRRQTLWTAGMGADGKPIPLPPALAKPLPPTAGASAFAAQSTAQAQWYADHGMSAKAAQLSDQAATYQKQVDADTKFAQQLKILDVRNVNSERLAAIRESGSVARAAAASGTRELAADSRMRSEYTVKAAAGYKDAYNNLFKLTKGTQKVDENGQPVPGAFNPPAIDKDNQQKLAGMIRQIRSSEDPAGFARYIASRDDVPPAVADVIQSFGTAADLEKRGKGTAPPDLPDSYYDAMFKKANGGGAAAGITGDIKQMSDAGADPRTNTQARGALVAKYGEAAVSKALGGSHPAPAAPDNGARFHRLNTSVNIGPTVVQPQAPHNYRQQ